MGGSLLLWRQSTRAWTCILVRRWFIDKGGMGNILGVFWLPSIGVLVELEERPGVCADVTIGPCEMDCVLDVLRNTDLKAATDTELEPLCPLVAAFLS